MTNSVVAAALGLALTISTATAQSSFEEFMKIEEVARQKDSVADREIAQFEDILNSSNTNSALRAMKFMLASDKPYLVQRAKEFGLLADESVFRREALRTILDEGGPFRIEIDLSSAPEQETQAKWWIDRSDGGYSTDGNAGFYLFRTGSYDTERGCWPFDGSNQCAFYLSNLSLSLKDWNDATGSMTLNDDGILTGTFQVDFNGRRTPLVAKISLLE